MHLSAMFHNFRQCSTIFGNVPYVVKPKGVLLGLTINISPRSLRNQRTSISGWWFQPLWKIWVRQVGWWYSQYCIWKNTPVMFQSTNQTSMAIFHRLSIDYTTKSPFSYGFPKNPSVLSVSVRPMAWPWSPAKSWQPIGTACWSPRRPKRCPFCREKLGKYTYIYIYIYVYIWSDYI